MARYKNISGSPWRRPDGSMVPPGGTFTATAREHDRILRRGYRGRLESTTNAPPKEKKGGSKVPKKDVAPKAKDNWPLKMTPQLYLKLHPKGPHAKLAQAIVDRAAKKE